jgi:hypothetical protein
MTDQPNSTLAYPGLQNWNIDQQPQWQQPSLSTPSPRSNVVHWITECTVMRLAARIARQQFFIDGFFDTIEKIAKRTAYATFTYFMCRVCVHGRDEFSCIAVRSVLKDVPILMGVISTIEIGRFIFTSMFGRPLFYNRVLKANDLSLKTLCVNMLDQTREPIATCEQLIALMLKEVPQEESTM